MLSTSQSPVTETKAYHSVPQSRAYEMDLLHTQEGNRRLEEVFPPIVLQNAREHISLLE